MNTKRFNVQVRQFNHPVMKMVMMAVLLCSALSVSAQVERNQIYNIMLGEIRYTHHNEKMSAGDALGQIIVGAMTGKTSVQASNYEEEAKTAVVRGLSNAYRYRFTDRLPQYGDESEAGNLVVDVLITNIQATSESKSYKDKNGKTHVDTNYKGAVDATLTLKDVMSGEVIATPSFSGSGSGSSVNSSQQKVVSSALGALSGRITEWLNRSLPLQANIIQGNTVKKDKQKQVYIDLGSREGAFAGLHMGVYIVKTIAGREAKQQIGKLKIESVQGEDISLCKVQSGGKEIKTALEAGEQLAVTSL